MRRLGTKITTSGEHKINIAATKPAAAWIEEGGALTFGDATFDQILMDAHKLHVAIKVTEELLYDNAFNLENYILTQFGKALANAEEDAFLNGDGEGKPTGLFHATKGGQVADTVTSIKADDLINLVYALKRPYRKKASFIINDKNLAVIRKLKDGNGAYMWQPSYQTGEPDRILGYPVNTSAYMEDAWADVEEEDYVATKNKIARRMIDKFERVLGVSITPYIEEIEVATPWTMCNFVNTPQGSAYGYELDDWDSMMARMRMMGTENEVKGLKFVGAASIRGDGYNSSIFSGNTMAKLTLADMRKEEEG